MAKVRFTKLNKTKLVPRNIVNGDGSGQYDDVLWIERPEDWYALDAFKRENKRVLVVERRNWIKAPEV